MIADCEQEAHYLSRHSQHPILLEDPSKPIFSKSDSLHNKDAFIAISGNFEKNLFSCLVAYQKNVPYTISFARYPEHVNFISTIPLTSFINPAMVAANKIMKYHKIDTIASRTILNFEQLECLEINTTKSTPICGQMIHDLPFKESRIIAIKRRNKLITGRGNTKIRSGDKVLLSIVEEEKHLLQKLI